MNHPRPRLLLGWLVLVSLASATFAAPGAAEKFRGGKVVWARLIAGAEWNRHASTDTLLLNFMRDYTSLNIEPQWKSADPQSLPDLCAYPFLYATGIESLRSVASRNLAEYLRRGGFLFIDACVNINVTPDPDDFLRYQLEVLRQNLPELRVATISPNHEVFSIYFKMRELPQTRSRTDRYWPNGPTIPLQAVFLGDRMIALISRNGFQCGVAGWGYGTNFSDSMQMITNIYVYAMTR